MGSDLKRYLVSTATTFVTTFIIGVGAQLSLHTTVTWTATFWLPILASAVRAGVKAVGEYFTGLSGDTTAS